MCFVFGALKIRDRIQNIPFKIVSKASRAPQYRGVLIQDVNFRVALLLGGGVPKIKEGPTLSSRLHMRTEGQTSIQLAIDVTTP